MSKALTAKSYQELKDSTPQPGIWPVCGECGVEFILRRSLLVTVGRSMAMRVGWAWVRDCKHKRSQKTDRVEREKKGRRGPQ